MFLVSGVYNNTDHILFLAILQHKLRYKDDIFMNQY